MKTRKTCIICPNGCDLDIETDANRQVSVSGATCKRGETYAVQEMLHPVRTISSSVLVSGGEKPLVSVRLNAPVPKEKIMDVMTVIRSLTVKAPVHPGDVLYGNVLGLDSDVIATSEVLPEGGRKA